VESIDSRTIDAGYDYDLWHEIWDATTNGFVIDLTLRHCGALPSVLKPKSITPVSP